MGHHYVPQYYLQGFGTLDDSTLIWRYARDCPVARCLPVKVVAQEVDYYKPQDEVDLNLHVECPANPILKRLREQPGMLSRDDKEILSNYLSAMHMRVPKTRETVAAMGPAVLEDLLTDFNRQLDAKVAENPSFSLAANAARAEASRAREEYGKELPEDLVRDIARPMPRPKIVNALLAMNWVFFTNSGGPLLITSDAPVFFFPWLGIGRSVSELTFPVSPSLLLFLHNTNGFRESVLPGRSQLFKEANRRTISNATRFVFSPTQQDWISLALAKAKPRLSRILP